MQLVAPAVAWTSCILLLKSWVIMNMHGQFYSNSSAMPTHTHTLYKPTPRGCHAALAPHLV
jgi:hypothetical protein